MSEILLPTDAQILLMLKDLTEFGYRLTEDEVRAEARKALAGERPSNVIGLFVTQWLKEMGS